MSKLLRGLAAVAVASVSLASGACAAPIEEEEASASSSDELRDIDPSERVFLDRLNQYRGSIGAPRVVATRALTQAAFNHSQDMGSRSYFAHESPEGGTHRTRMRREGYNCGYCGEILHYGGDAGEGAFESLRNSAPHDAIMRDGRFRAVGIGRAFAPSTNRWYWTAVFGPTVDASGDASTGGPPPPPPPPAPPPPPPPAASCGSMGPGGVLGSDQAVASCQGTHKLVMQGDGNLVMYGPGGAVWSSGTNGQGGDRAIMQGDGNLVVYRGDSPLWSSRTGGHPGAWLAIQDDANVVVYSGSTPLWASRR